MSFADSVRTELCELPIKKNCCRKAMAAGLLTCAERISGHEVRLRMRYESVASLAEEVFAKLYGKAPEIAQSASHGHRYWDVTLQSPAASKLVAQMRSADADWEALLNLDACEGCRSALLRGMFFVAGTVNDPQKASHLEMSLPDASVADAAACFLDACGYPPKRITRKNAHCLYYKDGGAVGDLVTLMGSHNIIFEFYNARIAGDIRNNENRATNCVTRNIEKSVSAAARQIEAIGRLMEHGTLDALPEPLRVTALLRYRNPDATLDELKDLHKPPISKSGLNHRLQKLMDAAEK
ncbi:MAG: DNA-binding protein WhiA [Clostridia bacterium]|nr:DNA-binding protein WhiA [Clostridia bacterium]